MSRHRITNWTDWLISLDYTLEHGDGMYSHIHTGQVIIVECPQRWYIGVVEHVSPGSVVLNPLIVGHAIGNLAMFYKGEVSEGTQLTLSPRSIQIGFHAIESVQPYPAEHFNALWNALSNPAPRPTGHSLPNPHEYE